jgi:hypothetical protein
LAFHDRHVFVGVSNRDSAVFSDWALHALETVSYRSPGTLGRLIEQGFASSVAAAAEGASAAGAVADHGTMDEYDPADPGVPYDPAEPSAPSLVTRSSHKRRHSGAPEAEDPRQLHRHDIADLGQSVRERVLTLQQHVAEVQRDAAEHGSEAAATEAIVNALNDVWQHVVAMETQQTQ